MNKANNLLKTIIEAKQKFKIHFVGIKLVEKEDSKLKAFASITIDDCFVVHDIRLIDGANGLFVSMPSKKMPDGLHKDIVHPINTDTREAISAAIVEAYNNALNAPKE